MLSLTQTPGVCFHKWDKQLCVFSHMCMCVSPNCVNGKTASSVGALWPSSLLKKRESTQHRQWGSQPRHRGDTQWWMCHTVPASASLTEEGYADEEKEKWGWKWLGISVASVSCMPNLIPDPNPPRMLRFCALALFFSEQTDQTEKPNVLIKTCRWARGRPEFLQIWETRIRGQLTNEPRSSCCVVRSKKHKMRLWRKREERQNKPGTTIMKYLPTMWRSWAHNIYS